MAGKLLHHIHEKLFIAFIKSSNIYTEQSPIMENPIISFSCGLLPYSIIDEKFSNPQYRDSDACCDGVNKEETLFL